MPLIEYKCAGCGNIRELLVRRTGEAEAPACPSCGFPMEKKFSVFAAKAGGSGGGCGQAPGGCGGGGGFS